MLGIDNDPGCPIGERASQGFNDELAPSTRTIKYLGSQYSHNAAAPRPPTIVSTTARPIQPRSASTR